MTLEAPLDCCPGILLLVAMVPNHRREAAVGGQRIDPSPVRTDHASRPLVPLPSSLLSPARPTFSRPKTRPIEVPVLPMDEPKCFGLPKLLCHDEQDMANAAEGTDECKKLFCDPPCLKATYACEIAADGIFKAAGQSPVQRGTIALSSWHSAALMPATAQTPTAATLRTRCFTDLWRMPSLVTISLSKPTHAHVRARRPRQGKAGPAVRPV